MEGKHYWIGVATKARTLRNPVMKITPSESMVPEEWARVLYIVGTMMKKVSETVGNKFMLDLDEAAPLVPECKLSEDGYHEVRAVDQKDTPPIVSCIYCGLVSKVSTKTEFQITEHFKYVKEGLDLPF